MSLYYNGDLEKDLEGLYSSSDSSLVDQLDIIGKQIGYGRCQQILQVLWAKKLQEGGYPTTGALFR